MIPNHKRFIEAINDKHKVCLRFYSRADSAVIDLVCAPIDYGPGAGVQDGVNRYWLWDYTSNTGSPLLGLLPEQVLDIRILGEVFDANEITAPASNWSIPRDWKTSSGLRAQDPSSGPAQSETQANISQLSHPVKNQT